jgi:hypothetical protein
MPDKKTENVESLPSLTDDQIVTERKVARRSFLASSGAVLAGAAGLVAGLRAATARTVSQDDPKPRPDDPPPPPPPDQPRPEDNERRRDDPDKPRRDDPDKPRPEDRERRRDDPDKPRPSDPKPPDAARR